MNTASILKNLSSTQRPLRAYQKLLDNLDLREYKPESTLSPRAQKELREATIKTIATFCDIDATMAAVFFDSSLAPLTTNFKQLQAINLEPLHPSIISDYQEAMDSITQNLKKININLINKGYDMAYAYDHLYHNVLTEPVRYAVSDLSDSSFIPFTEYLSLEPQPIE